MVWINEQNYQKVLEEHYPLFQKYKIQVTGSPNPTGIVRVYSDRGVPDWLFVYADRDLSANAVFVPENNPLISGLEVYGRTNKDKALVTYLKDKHEIWQATLRNAHQLASDDTLLKVGGVLLSKSDLGTLERHEFRIMIAWTLISRYILRTKTVEPMQKKQHAMPIQ